MRKFDDKLHQTALTSMEAETRRMTAIENSAIKVLTIFAAAYAFVFLLGQINANCMISDAANAVKGAAMNSSEIEYKSAIQYMEYAQQAYSASSATNITSIIYGLVTAIILGYGGRMLRLGAEERDKLRNLEAQIKEDMLSLQENTKQEISEHVKKSEEHISNSAVELKDSIQNELSSLQDRTKEEISNHVKELQEHISASANDMNDSIQKEMASLKEKTKLEISNHVEKSENRISISAKEMQNAMEKQFITHNKVYIATTACQHAGYLCTLLESHIALSKQSRKNFDTPDKYMSGLHVNFIRSLNYVSMVIERYIEGTEELTDETFHALEYSWNLAKYSMRSYIGIEGRSSLVRDLFPDDEEFLRELYRKIDNGMQTLKKAWNNHKRCTQQGMEMQVL